MSTPARRSHHYSKMLCDGLTASETSQKLRKLANIATIHHETFT
jgi:hypothetical protein